MEHFSLELTMTITEGAIHNLGNLVCLAWIRASSENPLHQAHGKAVVIHRPAGNWGKLESRELILPIQDLAHWIKAMRRMGVPERTPSVQARAGNPTGWQQILLQFTLNDHPVQISTVLQYGGLEGADAALYKEALHRLFEMLGVDYLDDWIKTP